MSGKTGIIGHLGEAALLVPRLVEGALGANDRVKYYFSLLQVARGQAEGPGTAVPDLSNERRLAGVDDAGLDAIPGAARKLSDGGGMMIPGAAALHARIVADIEAMMAPLRSRPGGDGFAARFDALQAALPVPEGDVVAPGYIDAVTSGRRDVGDSLHLLVMDLHQGLNRLQAHLATEAVNGALTYGLGAGDRPLVAAFMTGVNRTAPLKFDHPGLGTTATRAGDRLVIQNDIGTTDAHVLMVHVDAAGVTITYTDIHLLRARFFESLFAGFDVAWRSLEPRTAPGVAESDLFYLCTGVFSCAAAEDQMRFLEFLGSRLVFLIDWNKARKSLRAFVSKDRAIELLRQAAVADWGHRAFLMLGGDRLIFAAMESAARAPLPYGRRLDEILGPDAAAGLIRFAFKACAEGLRVGRSERFIRDEVRAELARSFESAEHHLLGLAGRHAALIFDLATTMRDTVLGLAVDGDGAPARRAADRAAAWESAADRLVIEARAASRRLTGADAYRVLLESADDAADGLEEAAFLTTLLPAVPSPPLMEAIQVLTGLLVDGAQEYVKALDAASAVQNGTRDDVQDFLEAVDRLVTVEHRTDQAQRAVTSALAADPIDGRQLFLIAETARVLEEAADALARSGLHLHDHILNEVVGR